MENSFIFERLLHFSWNLCISVQILSYKNKSIEIYDICKSLFKGFVKKHFSL